VHGIKIQPPVVDLECLMFEVEKGVDGVVMNMDKGNLDMLRVIG
jgi:hypothetical protein